MNLKNIKLFLIVSFIASFSFIHAQKTKADSLSVRLKNESQSHNKDGMDIILCSFDLKNMKMQYAGANRPLYIVRNNEPIEVAPTKAAIGGYTLDNFEFNNKRGSIAKRRLYLYVYRWI